MLTMRRTVALVVRMCTGRAAPSRIGPIATPLLPVIFSMLYVMLPVSRLGMTRRLARPFSVLSG